MYVILSERTVKILKHEGQCFLPFWFVITCFSIIYKTAIFLNSYLSLAFKIQHVIYIMQPF